MLLIGFGNRARQGKDTAAEAIRDYYLQKNAQFIKHGIGKLTRVGLFKYADALYEEVNEALKNGIWETRAVEWTVVLNPTDRAFVTEHTVMPPGTTGKMHLSLPDWVQPDSNPEKSDRAPYGKHPKLLQWWGTEYRRRHFGENYWVDKTFASIPGNTDIALISDARFSNEVDAVKQRGGYTVKVERLNHDGTQYFASDRPKDHPSETALDNYNWDFYLKGKEAVLKAEQAITLVEYLRGLHESN